MSSRGCARVVESACGVADTLQRIYLVGGQSRRSVVDRRPCRPPAVFGSSHLWSSFLAYASDRTRSDRCNAHAGISTARRGRCGGADRAAHCEGAGLSGAAGADRGETAPGSAADIHARLLGQWLSERLGQSFVIENRPGAGNNIGTEAVVRSRRGRLHAAHVAAAAAINATLYEKLNFNFVRDIAPVASLVTVPNVMAVHPSFRCRSVPEFIAYAKANPGKINTGRPARSRSSLERAVQDDDRGEHPLHPLSRRGFGADRSLAGQLQVAFATLPGSIEYLRSGHSAKFWRWRPRLWNKTLPDIPTIGEFVPGYELSGWQGIGVPGTRRARPSSKLNKEINAALADPKIAARIAELGGSALQARRLISASSSPTKPTNGPR